MTIYYIKFEVSLHFCGIWPTVRHAALTCCGEPREMKNVFLSFCLYSLDVQRFLENKVHIFWEGFGHLFIWYYFVVSNHKWKIGQIFVAFLEYLNFTKFMLTYLVARMKTTKAMFTLFPKDIVPISISLLSF